MATVHSQTDTAIVRVIGYRSRFDMHVINPNPQDLVNIPASFTFLSPLAVSTCGVDIFSKLPVELMTQILDACGLDINSFLIFGQVNRRARQIVISLPKYRVIITHAPTCFIALVRSGLARHFTFKDIHRALTTPSCDVCGKSAGYIYLLTARRACEDCLQDLGCVNRFTTTTLSLYSLISGWTEDKLRQHLPVARLVQEQLFNHDRNHYLFTGGPIELINLEEARDVVKTNERRLAGFSVKVQGCDVSAPVPLFDVTRNTSETPLGCRGCAVDWEEEVKRPGFQFDEDRKTIFSKMGDVYTKKKLLEHFQRSGKAQELWAASHEGIVQIE